MKKFIFTSLFALAALGLRAERISTTINSGWYFHRGEIALADTDFDKKWERIDLPHTWNSEDAFDETPGYYRGVGWYACQLAIPAAWKGNSVVIHFEGVNQVARVFVNGKAIGSHTGGYTAFNFDISEAIDYGARNLIKVWVDNSHNADIPPLKADFTFYGGIYRNVRLVVADRVHFDLANCASEGVFVLTPQVSRQSATLVVKGDVANHSSSEKKLLVETQLLDGQGREVARKEVKLTVKAGATAPFSLEGLTLSDFSLYLSHHSSKMIIQ
ncbi:hypothetical protein FACS1894159_04920 [Bacteroidia bacterium]|nr:hypothetical protein FACS1894159_04920 [Bacteroidia bacterium]